MKAQLTVDAAGRLVLPKSVRQQFHLTPGSSLELNVQPDAIVLKPEGIKAPLVQEGSLLVHRGTATLDLLQAVAADRAHRDRQVAGMST